MKCAVYDNRYFQLVMKQSSKVGCSLPLHVTAPVVHILRRIGRVGAWAWPPWAHAASASVMRSVASHLCQFIASSGPLDPHCLPAPVIGSIRLASCY
jgi:hypothetical protein